MQISLKINRRQVVDLIMLMLTIILLMICISQPLIGDASALPQINSLSYLRSYGYINSSKSGASSITGKSLSKAISQFQKKIGLDVTGELDEKTIEAMQWKRCGNPDFKEWSKDITPIRKKRLALSQKRWPKRLLTYKIINTPSNCESSSEEVKIQINKALNVWSEVAQLDFVHEENKKTDIEFKFLKEHNDSLAPFNNEGDTLAHAFFPDKQKGGVHFNDYVNFTIDKAGLGADIFQLAVHEIGHALGIDHNEKNDSIMYPVYTYRSKFALDRTDIEDVQGLFGKRRNSSLDESPDLCFDPAFDAITRTEDGTTYIFKDKFYWRLTIEGISKDSASRIKTDWAGLPGSLDAAATLPDGKTYFFKNDQCWIFRNKIREAGPKLINSVFPGIPSNINAVFFWDVDQQLYFFKGTGYWKFSDGKVAGENYPHLIANVWKGVPNYLNDAITWQDNKTYFFKEDSYYRFNNDDDEVDSRVDVKFPRPINYWWFGCDVGPS